MFMLDTDICIYLINERLFVQVLDRVTTRPINENSSITSATVGYRVPVTFLRSSPELAGT